MILKDISKSDKSALCLINRTSQSESNLKMTKNNNIKQLEEDKEPNKRNPPNDFKLYPPIDYRFSFNQMYPLDIFQPFPLTSPSIFTPTPGLAGIQSIRPPELYRHEQVRLPLPPTRFEDEPRYVNAKQYVRIIKMREKRARQPEKTKPIRKYKHESRHIHATRRERCNNGRFISKEKSGKGEAKSNQIFNTANQLLDNNTENKKGQA